MVISENRSLLPFNTFGIDVRADYVIEYKDIDELREVLGTDLLRSGRFLHVGSGSNLLFTQDFRGVILHSQNKSIRVNDEDDESVYVEVGAGVVWDDFVAFAVDKGLGGVENLSLIPGEAGASAVQNIGAYGVEVSDVIVSVNGMDTESRELRTFAKDECNYGYRDSVFKRELKGKFIVISVVFKLNKLPIYKLNYQHLEQEVMKKGTINLKNIRETIINIRRQKLPDVHELGNAGSFFMNPVISENHFKKLLTEFPEIPHYLISETKEKIPAGWLIESCGWKGKRIGNAGVHAKQALVIVNLGGASPAEIMYLAQQIQNSVRKKFEIELTPEVNFI